MKSLSWKQSIIAVILLHLFGYLAVSQYSNYRNKIKKNLKESKEALYANKLNKPNDWPKITGKPVVVKPLIKSKPKENKNSIVIDNDTIKKTVNDIQNIFSKQVNDIIAKEPPKVNKVVTAPPPLKPTPKPKPQKTSNVVYTSTKKITTPKPQPSYPESIPVRRAIAVSNPQIQNIPIEEPNIQNIPEIIEYTTGNENFRETNQTVQRVVRTYVVLQ